MTNQVDYIYIEQLFGGDDYKISFTEDKLILVAPNGSGKTTVLRIIYHYLSGQWEKLNHKELKSIRGLINGQEIEVYEVGGKGDQKISKKRKKQILSEHPNQVEALDDLLNNSIKELQSNPFLIEETAAKYDAHEPLLKKVISDLIHKELKVDTLPLKDIQILFLPTYRRIERRVEDVFPDFAKHLTTLLKENVEGVADSFGREQTELKDIRKEYDKKKTEEDKRAFLDVLAKDENLYWITKSVLEKESYSKLESSLIDEIDSYWKKVNEPNKKINKEQNLSYEELVGFGMDDVAVLLQEQYRKINSGEDGAKNTLDLFIRKCSKFMEQKKISYDPSKKELQIVAKGKALELGNLSSGEKQLISLFANIIFSERATFLIFDEPELSLSMQWQEKLLKELDDLEKLNGFVVATHS
ncbi:MAG: Predicted ATP-binding protein involved in virulence, partial [uncultured Aureispira sp.]